MGYQKFRRQIAAQGGIALGAGSLSTLRGTVANNATHSGTPLYSGTPSVSGRLDVSSGQFLAPNGTVTANGTANLLVGVPGMIRVSKNGATVQFGFVVGGSAFSLTATSGGTVTLVNHT